MKAKALLIAIPILVYAGKAAQVMLFAPSDNQQIEKVFYEAIVASREGKPGSLIDKLSFKFKVNGMEPGMRKVADFIRDSKPELQASYNTPSIHDNEGLMTSNVKIKAQYLAFSFDGEVKNVEFVFKKESTQVWLFIPSSTWRLEQVNVPNESIQEALGGALGL